MGRNSLIRTRAPRLPEQAPTEKSPESWAFIFGNAARIRFCSGNSVGGLSMEIDLSHEGVSASCRHRRLET